jgi:Protein of unknown function (DUF1592)/Protein of unknown function (DUF1588)/Protein of unknown function (DUF1587)/Protein of unknown function (DUF1585)/Protein of unknown function (DUF1595)/Ca-dependent carbohydrate-binding module xylan-binding/Cytochrome C oxidase, cbb3-type, subunit III
VKASSSLFAVSLSIFGAGALLSIAHPSQAKPASFTALAKPVLKKYCISCHSGPSAAAGVDFTKYDSEASMLKGSDVWTQAARYLASKHMPPAGSPQLPEGTRQQLVLYVQKVLNSQCGLADPGRVTIHRLNRAEYANTVHDLLGVEFQGTDDFPNDDVGYGFDNISDVLSMSPLLMEKYLNAAEQVAQKAIVLRDGDTKDFDPTDFKFAAGRFANVGDQAFEFFSEGTAFLTDKLTKGGHYIIKIRAYGDQAGPAPANMRVTMDEKTIGRFDVKGRNLREAEDFSIPISAYAGTHKIGVAFTNDYYNPKDPNPKNRDRNLYVVGVSVEGPQEPDFAIPETQSQLLATEPAPGQEAEAAKAFFTKFASLAYRRPATADEIQRLSQYVALAMKNGDSFDRGIQVGIEAALCSPSFLFRIETDPKPNDPGAKRLLNGYELASRLSYFLWSSMPDRQLFALAADGSLEKPEILVQQAMRMLRDPRSQALSENFATQWLTLRKLAIVSPDKNTYPSFDDTLRQDMAQETKDFFASVINNDSSVVDFLDGRYTFINGRLAKLYGIDGVTGDDFRKVSLEGTPRAGILTQASVLTVTSNPTRTSPTKRGKWVLEEILGTPPPPPPPGVGVINEQQASANVTTLRQMMEEHRKNPACAACHARMDPLGFGLENFDGVGKWRDKEGKFPIDSSGELPDGRKFDGPTGLTTILVAQKDLFVRCLGEKLLTYSLGRGLTASDQCVLDGIEKKAAANGYKFSALVKAIVLSDPFRKRRGDSVTE